MRAMILATVLMMACSSGGADTGATDTSSGTSADQACTDSAKAQCQKLDACHVDGVAIRYGAMELCVSRVKANCLVALGAPNTGRTSDNQEACALAYAGASCADFVQGSIAACLPPAGTRAIGGPCTYSAQCQSAFCAIPTGTACGTCAASPTAGQSCASSQCGPGQQCQKATTSCQPFGAAGDKCSSTSECVVGLACVGASSASGTTGTCVVGAETLSAACDRTSGPQCDEVQGLYCSFTPKQTAGTCVKFLKATAGGACGFTAGSGTTGSSYTICTGASQCVVQAGANGGSCVGNALEGKPCDTTNGPACLSPARCITAPGLTSGTCQLPDPTQC